MFEECYWLCDSYMYLYVCLGRAHYMLLVDLYRAGPNRSRMGPDICMLCGIFGNSLRFVLIAYVYGFKYLWFKREGPDMIT